MISAGIEHVLALGASSKHAAQEMPFFQQEIFELAQAGGTVEVSFGASIDAAIGPPGCSHVPARGKGCGGCVYMSACETSIRSPSTTTSASWATPPQRTTTRRTSASPRVPAPTSTRRWSMAC